MKVGILGTGFGVEHAKLYKKMDGIENIKIFGRDTTKLSRIQEELNIEITNDISEIIEDPNIDLIDVCLPSSVHKQYVIEALKNGKHVFCETPVAVSIEDAIEMKLAEQKYGKRVYINQFIKFEHPYEYLNDVVEKEELGKLKALHIKRNTPPLWGDLSLHKISTDLMIHDFDFVTWLLGIPEGIVSQGVNGKKGQSHVHALLKYPETIVSVEGSSMMPFGYPFTVGYDAIFEHGTIKYKEDGFKDRVESSFDLYTNDKVEQIEMQNQNCYEETIKHVIECCQRGIPTRIALEEAVNSFEVALKVKKQILPNV